MMKVDLIVVYYDDFFFGVLGYVVEILLVCFNKEVFFFDQVGYEWFLDILVLEFVFGWCFFVLVVFNFYLIVFVSDEEFVGLVLGELG